MLRGKKDYRMNRLRQEISQSALGGIERIAPDRFARRYRFSSRFVGFDGHFPAYPVLPAFVQVLTAWIVAEEWKNNNLSIHSVEKAKFHIEIKPDQEIQVNCRELTIGDKSCFDVNLTVAEGLASNFLIRFEQLSI